MANVTECGSDHHLENSRNISTYFPFLYVNKPESRTVSVFIVFISIIGMFGNGTVIWFLCSNRKKNPFMFITNLSVADFGVLSAVSANLLLFFCVNAHGQSHKAVYIVHLCLHIIYTWMHYASANFLMIISIDRCVAVLFPIWCRGHRSKVLLVKTSATLWVLSGLIAGLSFFTRFCYNKMLINIIALGIIYFLVVLSTAVLSFKVCCNPHLYRRGKLLVAIIISLFFFIVTMVPRGFFYNIAQKYEIVASFLLLLKVSNSSINPIIYFFVGIQKAGSAKKTLKAVFQKFFKEEEYTVEEGETSANTSSTGQTSTPPTS